jgi:hypothetical protein
MTAQRYGGAYSPGGAPAPDPKRPDPKRPGPSRPSFRRHWYRGSLRAALIGAAATPLAFAVIGQMAAGDGLDLIALAAAYAAILFGAALTAAGVQAAREYEARAVASPPAFPRKLFGAGFTALGVGLASFFGSGLGAMETGVFAFAAAGLHVLAFRPDPMRAKGVDGLVGEALDAAVAKIENSRALIAYMTAAAQEIGDAELAAEVRKVAEEAEAVVRLVERDPMDLRRVRRLLSVYLVGAHDATMRYAQTAESARDESARAEFLSLLDDLAEHVRRNRVAIESGARVALDVEIEVLRDRLKMESA